MVHNIYRSLKSQFNLIFGYCKEINADEETETLNLSSIERDQNIINLEFDVNFIKNLQKFTASNLKETIDQLKTYLNSKPLNENQDKKIYIYELNDYLKLFENLHYSFNQLLQSINGDTVFNNHVYQLHRLITSYTNDKYKLNFCELINQLINNSLKIIALIDKSNAVTERTGSVNQQMSYIDLNVLFNVKRYLQLFIQTKYLSSVYDRQPNTTAAMMIKNEQIFFKAVDFALPDFILEVNKLNVDLFY